jgi:hypothetical protein
MFSQDKELFDSAFFLGEEDPTQEPSRSLLNQNSLFFSYKEKALCNGIAASTQSLITTNPAFDSPNQQRPGTSFALSKRKVKKKKEKGKTEEKAPRNFEKKV